MKKDNLALALMMRERLGIDPILHVLLPRPQPARPALPISWAPGCSASGTW